MTVKTTLTVDREIYKAAKRVAVENDTTVSSLLRKALLVYISDPESVEETVSLLMDKRAIVAIRRGEEARKKSLRDYYIDWDKIREL